MSHYLQIQCFISKNQTELARSKTHWRYWYNSGKDIGEKIRKSSSLILEKYLPLELLTTSHRPSVAMISTSDSVTSSFSMSSTRTSGWGVRNGLMYTGLPELDWAFKSWSPNPRVTPMVASNLDLLPSPYTSGKRRSSEIKWAFSDNLQEGVLNIYYLSFFNLPHTKWMVKKCSNF